MGRGEVVDRRLAVERGRQVEPQPEDVPAEVADVAIEDVEGGHGERDRQREDQLHHGDDRDEQEVDRQPIGEPEQHDPDQRDEPEREVGDPGHDRRGRQHDLRKVDLLDQPVLRRDRRDAVADRGREPLPGQDRREDEQGIVLLLALEDELDEHDVDEHLEERVEDPPEVAEEAVGALLLEVGPDQVPDEPPA